MMTKEEFYHEMLALKEKYIDVQDDKEDFHIKADELMCKLLIELGYGQGAEVFLDEPKWYA